MADVSLDESLTVVAYAAAALVLLTMLAAINVIKMRNKHKVALGDGKVNDLIVAQRAFGNLTEYAPLFLVVLLIAQLRQAPTIACVVVAIIFVLGRAIHFFTMSAMPTKGRIAGMMATFIGLVGAALLAFGGKIASS